MPRIPRGLMDTSFFHVMCQGINKEYIFDNKKDIMMYKNLVRKYKKNNIEIIAYCIMNNHVHLLIYTNEVDSLTQFMHKINTIYGIYYNKTHNRVGYVFRDRFKSESIKSGYHLKNCIDYIHLNPVKAKICTKPQLYMHSSYNEYIGKKYIITDNAIRLAFGDEKVDYEIGDVEEEFIEVGNNYEKCKRIIENFTAKSQMTIEEIIKSKEYLKELVRILNKENKISYRIIEFEIGIKKDRLRRLIM